MNKTSNYTSSSTFKLFNNKNNKSKLDTTTNNGNNASMIKKEIK